MLLPPPIVRRFVWTSWLPVFDFLRAISILPTDSWQSLPPRTCLAVHNFCGAPLRFEESLGLQWFGGETSRDKGRGKESTAVVQRSTGWETNTQQGKARSSGTHRTRAPRNTSRKNKRNTGQKHNHGLAPPLTGQLTRAVFGRVIFEGHSRFLGSFGCGFLGGGRDFRRRGQVVP